MTTNQPPAAITVQLHPTQLRPLIGLQGVYVLKHKPTGKLYFGRSANLLSAAQVWHYAIGNPGVARNTNARVQELGNDPSEWLFTVLDHGVSEAQAKDLTHQYCKVIRGRADGQEQLLNLPPGRPPGTINGAAQAPRRRRSKNLSPLALAPVGSARVPFHEYLKRAVEAQDKGDPTLAAITELWEGWNRHQMTTPPPAVPGLPSSVRAVIPAGEIPPE